MFNENRAKAIKFLTDEIKKSKPYLLQDKSFLEALKFWLQVARSADIIYTLAGTVNKVDDTDFRNIIIKKEVNVDMIKEIQKEVAVFDASITKTDDEGQWKLEWDEAVNFYGFKYLEFEYSTNIESMLYSEGEDFVLVELYFLDADEEPTHMRTVREDDFHKIADYLATQHNIIVREIFSGQ